MPDPLPSSATQPGRDSASGSGSSTFDPGTGPSPPAPPGTVPEFDVHALPTVQPAAVSTPAAGAPPVVPGYEVLGVLGRGGMGVVYRARQASLNRLVALKMIRGGQASAEDLTRFRTEAEAVARLQHPNVVQIHEVGEHDGLPFFSLELLEGGSLSGRLDGTPLPPRQAAQLVRTLAGAVHEAHRRGIVHRDLKPANVLLSGDGVPKITDFGLAKLLDAAAGLTATGEVMGTPSYMAPEQTGQTTDSIGPATDVYALGAILYELLTGRPPFKAATPLDTLFQVVNQEPVPPRQLQPKVPRDLETICLRCLRKEPARRYASADALADDLGRFLQGQPIQARPTGLGERCVKWVRRQPALAALLAVCAVTVAGAIVGVVWHNVQLSAALRDVEKQQQEARLQRDRARDRLIAEAGVVEKFLLKVSESPEMKARGLEALRKKLLESAIPYYETFVREEDSEPKIQAERSRAYGRLAALLKETGNAAAADKAFLDALAIADNLATAHPSEAPYQSLLGTTLNSLAEFYIETNRPEAAEPLFIRAVGIWEALSVPSPDDVSAALGLSAAHNGLGRVYRRTKRMREAVTATEKGLQIAERIGDRHPEDGQVQESLAISHSNLGILLAQLGERGKARGHLLANIRIGEEPVAKDPTNVSYQTRLARGLLNQGSWYLEENQLKDATTVLARAKAIWTALHHEHPTVTAYAVELAGASCGLADTALISADFPAALAQSNEAVTTLKDLLAQGGPTERARDYLRMAYAIRAEALTDLRRCEEADRDWAEALKLDDRGQFRDRFQVSRALTLAVSGKHAEATAAALALAKIETTYGQIHFTAARVCSAAATSVAADAGLPQNERKKRAAQYVSQGLVALRRANELGFFRIRANRYALKALTDLDPLRAHEEFQALLAKLPKE
jgi:serine/threonine-protein kinase